MEKMDLTRFRELKNELINMLEKVDLMIENGKTPDQVILDSMRTRYLEIYKTISEHDLGDIDFEEWKGMILYLSEGENLDFSKTNANIDFSIIDYTAEGKEIPNLKGCNIRNFDFESTYYTSEMFDEQFIANHQEYFLPNDAPEELKEAYYNKKLTIQQFSDNVNFFKNKHVLNYFNNTINNEEVLAFINIYGNELPELFEKYKPVLDILVNNNGLKFTGNGWYQTEDAELKTKDDLLQESVIHYFSDSIIGGRVSHINEISNIEILRMISDFIPLNELPWNGRNRDIFRSHTADELLRYGITDTSQLQKPILDLHKVKEIMDIWPEDLINLGGFTYAKIDFIKKYGINSVIRLDEETNGIFSHELWSGDSSYLELFARFETEKQHEELPEHFSYEDFKNRIYEILLKSREEMGLLRTVNFPNYDFIEGEFREEHPEIFLNGDFDSKVKNRFYIGELTAEDIFNNPEIIPELESKNLVNAFNEKRIMLGINAVKKGKDGKTLRSIPYFTDFVEYITEKYGNGEFLKLCRDYGKCLDEIKLSLKRDDSIDVIREKIEDEIYNSIIKEEGGIDYFEELPDTFKNKHPELFLPLDVPKELRDKFYIGKLLFEDIREHPEIKDFLLLKNTRAGFRNSTYNTGRYGNLITGASKLWEKLSSKEILDLAEKYGRYLDYVNADLITPEQNLEERIEIIENEIETKILNREITYGKNTPSFFREKHPELFLDDDAPEELRKFFDSDLFDEITPRTANITFEKMMNEIINRNGNDHSDKLSLYLLSRNKDKWIQFLKGKDLRLAFPKEYDELFHRFGSDTILRIGVINPETIKKMVDFDKVEILETWYKATGGRFVPHHVVMSNFPVDEIEDFLESCKKWSRLMQVDNFSINDDGKSAILKMAYALGVFQGNDDGFKLAMDLISGLPSNLSNEDFSKVMKKFEENQEKIKLIQQVYKVNEDGSYSLNYNQQSNRDKTKEIRDILEKASVSSVLTLEKAHQIFGAFEMKFDPDFFKFFKANSERIVGDLNHLSDVSQIQKRFGEIKIQNASVRGGITFDVAVNYIRETPYKNVEIGNENLAQLVSQTGYSQVDFERLQELYDEAETRDFSSIPRVQGERNGYTYEILRLDDPLGLVIGKLTDCCQAIDDNGQTSMEHSMVSNDGRVFVVRDESGKIVAQSWVWRNHNVVCFDNVEIPEARKDEYSKLHPEEGEKGLARKVLEVYKQATKELVRTDLGLYTKMLNEGTISQEEYDELVIGKVTVGLGWNDTASAIKEDSDLVRDDVSRLTLPAESDRLPKLYTDAKYDPLDSKYYEGQWIIETGENPSESSLKQMQLFEDMIPVFDDNNISPKVLYMMQRMGKLDEDSNIRYVEQYSDNDNQSSNNIMRRIAYAYGFNQNETFIMATARIAILYSKKNEKIVLGDVFTAPISENLSKGQKHKVEDHIKYQLKKAIKQLGVSEENLDLSELDDKKIELIQSIIREIEDENKTKQINNSSERGE